VAFQRPDPKHLIVSLSLLAVIGGFEMFKPDSYIPIAGDVPTIGYGTTMYPDGTRVQLGEKISREHAFLLLKEDVSEYSKGVLKCTNAPMYQYEFDAFVSLAYNIGVPTFCGSSIPKKLQAGDFAGACSTLLQFNKMKDKSKPRYYDAKTKTWKWQYKVIKGLDNRRKKEYAMCIGGA